MIQTTTDADRIQAIKDHGGSIMRAAKALGVDYSGLLRFAKRQGLYKRNADPLKLNHARRLKLIAGARLILEALEDTTYDAATEK